MRKIRRKRLARRVKRGNKLPAECPYCGPVCLSAPKTNDPYDVRKFERIHEIIELKKAGKWADVNVRSSETIRAGVYSIESVFPFVLVKPFGRRWLIEFDGKMVKTNSLRYQVFSKSLICVGCGLVGSYFALEHHAMGDIASKRSSWHFNLYGTNAEGKEVLFTKDHIMPVSKGGSKKALYNMQTMCAICNNSKGNRHESETKDD